MIDLNLGETSIYLMSSLESDTPKKIIQITLEYGGPASSSEMWWKWEAVEEEVRQAITATLSAHKTRPVPPQLTITAPTYTLRLERRPWSYGRTWSFRWGEEVIESGEKWVFFWSDV